MCCSGFQQGGGLAPNFCHIALELVIRQLSVEVKSTVFYKSLQLIGYEYDINMMRRKKRAVCELYEELGERANKVGRAQHQS